MTEPVKQLSFGGVTYQEKQVVKKWKTNENGATRYNVLVKDSKSGAVIKIKYPQQKEGNNTKVSLFSTERYGADIRMEVDNLAYGKITGSDKTDFITLQGCNCTELDVSKDSNSDCISILDSPNYSSRNNVVTGNNRDRLMIDTGVKYTKLYLDGKEPINVEEATADIQL